MLSLVLLAAALCSHLSQLEDDCTQRSLGKRVLRTEESSCRGQISQELSLSQPCWGESGGGDVKRLQTQVCKPGAVTYQKDLPGELCCFAALPTACRDMPGGSQVS